MPRWIAGVLVAIAMAAYSLPSAAGGVLLARFLHGRGGAQLAGWNATLRATALAAIAIVYATGHLNVAVYVALPLYLLQLTLLAPWARMLQLAWTVVLFVVLVQDPEQLDATLR